MKMPSRMLERCQFQLDTNRINSKGKLKNIGLLERLAEKKIIQLELSEPAVAELERVSRSPQARKAKDFIQSKTLANTAGETRKMRKFGTILFPEGVNTEQKKRDVEIVFNAYKYGYILISNDGGSNRQPGGILGSRKELEALGVRIMRDHEAVLFVLEQLKLRDDRARNVALKTGKHVPSWVDEDLSNLVSQIDLE